MSGPAAAGSLCAVERAGASEIETDSQKQRVELDRRLTDAMRSAQGGDRAAYETVLRDSIPVIRRIARHQGAPPDSIDDVVQDVLVTVHGARASFDPARSYLAWLSAITQRRTIDLLRRHIRRGSREVFAPVAFDLHPADGTPEDDAVRHSEAERLRAHVAALPAGQREAIEALALDEISLEDASKATGRTKSSLKVNLHRAVKALRLRMSGERP